MAVHLRCWTGRTAPMYRVIAADSRKPRDGRFLEISAFSIRLEESSRASAKSVEQVLSWLRHGAQPTTTVRTLLKRHGVWKNSRPEKGEG